MRYIVLPVFGSEPMSNLNRTRTGPHVRFGVQQILDFAEPVQTCSNRWVKSAYLDVLNASELYLFELESNRPQSLVCTSNMIVAVELMDDQTGQKLLNHSKASRATELAPDRTGPEVRFGVWTFWQRTGPNRTSATLALQFEALLKSRQIVGVGDDEQRVVQVVHQARIGNRCSSELPQNEVTDVTGPRRRRKLRISRAPDQALKPIWVTSWYYKM
ncbi:hypothetical protein B0H11DRAFT_2208995 [Mycena galericulata]|nr:hypothetical protein B0H11DRAFT_2208995 [Mycena galericulata]